MEDYNVFKVLNLQRKETFHSAMIVAIVKHDEYCWKPFFDMLEEKGKEAKEAFEDGPKPLKDQKKKFKIDVLRKDENINFKDKDNHKWIDTEVYLEEYVDNEIRNRGRADIWIGTNIEKNENQYRLIIENKIDASNRYRQLRGYYRYLTGNPNPTDSPNREFAGLFYLCLKKNVNNANESALTFNDESKKGEPTRFAIITYEDDIIPWLYDVWKESTGDFKKAVADYLELVGELTGKKINEIYP